MYRATAARGEGPLNTQSPSCNFSAALKLYGDEPLATRCFLRLRRWLSPAKAIAAQVPALGSVLDIGCGHGLFPLALACANPSRRILGVDPSAAKIAIAARAGRTCPNVAFRHGLVDGDGGERFDVILLIDVLYLLAYEEKLAILQTCRKLLAPGGVLIVKASDTEPRWKYAVARAQERLMTGIGLTLGHGQLHFLSRQQNTELLSRAGFASEAHRLAHWTPYPHVLFVARE